ncbi:FAD-dependent oxidoreductase [Mycobacterium sp. B14F4]|uniref:FAD-dependent oxidoreductase n=1 Tax=Mycobacterium sp. B14F4 TaxID=3153565 RepID=UPI00325C4920
MRIVIVGAGPTGLFTATALARRGADVTLVDRDAGPPPRGEWRRRGVMQFHHAHSFRGHVVDALQAEMPDALEALVATGAEVVTAVAAPSRAATLRCRRSVFERELWRCAAGQPHLCFVTAHADEVIVRRGRATGVRAGGSVLDADLVIDASGRAGRFVTGVRGRGERIDCGATYTSRLYRLKADADPGPTNSVVGLSLNLDGYAAVVFLHDSRTFTVTVIHNGADDRLHRLRHDAVFEAAADAIPGVADWADPHRSVPMMSVLPGGRLYNGYRGQLDDSGAPVLAGLISAGDAVCTTTPLAGRGVSLALLQARALVGLIDRGTGDLDSLTTRLDAWCNDNIKPWFTDHCRVDAERMRRWSGKDVDLTRPLPSDLIVAAAEADPGLNDVVGPYVTMDALPASLAPAEPRAREIYVGGWRPTPAAGPTRDELSAVVSRTPAVA